jgi:hypothetical protein
MSEIALISARKSRLESSAKGIKVLKWHSIWLIHKINSCRRFKLELLLLVSLPVFIVG